MDQHRGAGIEAFDCNAALERTSARNPIPIVTTVCPELHNRGLGHTGAPFLAAAWTWIFGIVYAG